MGNISTGSRFYRYSVALDRGNVLRIVAEERVKTSVDSVFCAKYRSVAAWRNTPENYLEASAAAELLNLSHETKAPADFLIGPVVGPVSPEGLTVRDVRGLTARDASRSRSTPRGIRQASI